MLWASIYFDSESGQACRRGDEVHRLLCRRPGLFTGSGGKVTIDHNGIFDLKLRTRGKEKVKLKTFGKTPGLKIEPKFDFDGLLIDKGRFKLWVSDDARRLLAKAVINGKVADIKLVLCQVRGPGNDSWIELTRKHEDAADCREEKR